MYIIVVGGGRVGYYLTRALLSEAHEVLIIEKEASTCEGITDELGGVCLRGDGCEVATLIEAGTDRADMLIAVTGDDDDNLISCQVAKHQFKVPRTIARISNPRNEILFKKLGIDVTVSATNIILENIEKEVPTHPLTRLSTIAKDLEIVEVKVPSDYETIGEPVNELSLPSGSMLVLIIRGEARPFVPDTSYVIQPEDQIIAITPPESEEQLQIALRGKHENNSSKNKEARS
ncbi:MAG: TrkA family potassium uptake protein [Chloroflexi bacterium]|nr:TrkA family potassium uptake protein [Chloroflexota bacterium]